MREQLLYYAWKYKGDYHRIKRQLNAMNHGEKSNIKEIM